MTEDQPPPRDPCLLGADKPAAARARRHWLGYHGQNRSYVGRSSFDFIVVERFSVVAFAALPGVVGGDVARQSSAVDTAKPRIRLWNTRQDCLCLANPASFHVAKFCH